MFIDFPIDFYGVRAEAQLRGSVIIDLLDNDYYLRLVTRPALLAEIVSLEKKKYVVIDEVQKIPELLNEVHKLIEEKKIFFLMTGSSARKLKRNHANMLGGRASLIHFFPLSFSEIHDFNLEKYLTFGGLPRIYQSNDPETELDSYLTTYIEQEIKLEANLRNLPPFHRFLKSAALTNTELLNFANIASDSGVPATTVKEYYSILEDSLIGTVLEPWRESKKRKAIQTGKFYFFDPGISNYIIGTKVMDRNSNLWGKNFEQFIHMELKTYISYRQKRKEICFWRTVNKQEVDFIVGDEIAIEVKATKKISGQHFSGLRALKDENIIKNYYLVSEDPINRIAEDFINVIHWKDFLKKLWADEIL
ncbi:MAG: ATP-binding protein [Bdellovibrionaceae bacterium]|nr:ATP-binding protein [Pseudobdellovibrionaceae bacterium]